MDPNRKYLIRSHSIAFCMVVLSFLLWRSVNRAIFVEEAWTWISPILAFSGYIISLFLAIFIIREKTIFFGALALSLATCLMYSLSVGLGAVLLLAFFFICLGRRDALNEMKERIHLALGLVVRRSSRKIVWALCLVLASQYYFSTQALPTEKYIPKLEVSPATSKLIFRSFIKLIPNFKSADADKLTVDDFIWGIYQSRNPSQNISELLGEGSFLGSAVQGISPEQKAVLEKTVQETERREVISSGRKQFSEMAGVPVSGSEKMADIFSRILSNRLNGHFIPGIGKSESSSLFSGLIALVLLLTAISLASFLLLFWAAIISLIFFFLRRSGAVTIAKVSVEQEVID